MKDKDAIGCFGNRNCKTCSHILNRQMLQLWSEGQSVSCLYAGVIWWNRSFLQHLDSPETFSVFPQRITHIHQTLSFAGLLTTPEVWNSDTSSKSQENVVSLLVIVFSLYFWHSVAGYSGLIYFTVNLLSLLIWVGRAHVSSLCPCSFLQMLRFTQHSFKSCCHFYGYFKYTVTIYNISSL